MSDVGGGWNYRVFVKPVVESGEDAYFIGEAYYDKDGVVTSWTEGESAPYGDTLEELKADVARMRESLDRPVLRLTPDGDSLA